MSRLDQILEAVPAKKPHKDDLETVRSVASRCDLGALLEDYQNPGPNWQRALTGTQMRAAGLSEVLKLDFMERFSARQILTMGHLLGALEEMGPLHLQDLAAGGGRVSLVLRTARHAQGRRTTSSCYDKGTDGDPDYNELAGLLGLPVKGNTYERMDLTKNFPTPPSDVGCVVSVGYHIPGDVADSIVERTILAHGTHPHKTAVLATWHGDVATRSPWKCAKPSDWTAIRRLAGLARRDGRSSPVEDKLGGAAALVMDGIRARACIEAGVPAKVVELAPNGFSKPFPDIDGWCIVIG